MKVLIASCIALLSSQASAATHFAIISDFLNTKNDPARFDIVATSGHQVLFKVHQLDGDRSEIVTFVNGFATSSDLFNLGGSPIQLPALVSATTIDVVGSPDGVASTAVLRQKKLILAVRSNFKSALGSDFAFPLGDLGSVSGGGSGAHLLLGNPGAGTVTGNLVVNGVVTPFVVEAGGVTDVLLTFAPALVFVNANANLVTQLALVGKGQEFAMTIIPPI